MDRAYVYVTGGKGGVGKSTLAQAITDYLCATKRSVLLIDADPTNADSAACYKPEKDSLVRVVRARIRAEDASGQIDSSGLMDTLNIAETDAANIIVVDSPAGDTQLLQEAGTTITLACKQAKLKCIFVFVIDSNDRAAMNVLNAIWGSIQDADLVLLVRNSRKGTDFAHFDQSKIVGLIKLFKNVKIIDFPKIASRLETHLRIDRMSWAEVATLTPIGNRVEGARIREILHRTFATAGL